MGWALLYSPLLFLYLGLDAFFVFAFFKKKIYRNIFLDSGFIVLYPCRPAGGRQGAYRPAGGGRDLYVNKYFFLRRGPWRGLAAPLPGGRPPAAKWGAAGGLPPGRGAATQQGGGRLLPSI